MKISPCNSIPEASTYNLLNVIGIDKKLREISFNIRVLH